MILPLKQMRIAANKGLTARGEIPADSLSQGELALRIGISQGQVSRYEANPETIPFDLGHAWCQACGFSIDDALRFTGTLPQAGIDPGTPYSELHGNLHLLRQYVNSAPVIPSGLPPLSMTPDDLLLKVNHWSRKPTLLITGRFDSGKTRIANALLGSDELPSQYTPTTSIVTFVRHIGDRPEWQKEDVWIMKRGFNPGRWNDEPHCVENRLIAGGYETLKRFGTKDSEGEEIGAKAALVYMDAPLLKACTLIDVPGFQDDADDSEMAIHSAALADILLYTSPAKGFLDAADFLHLGQLLRTLQPVESPKDNTAYSNFFLIATHADPSISDADLTMILDKGAKRLYRHLGDSVFATSTHRLSEADLRKRMFSFWYESRLRREGIENGLLFTLSKILPVVIRDRVDTEVKSIKAQTRSDLRKKIDSYESAISEIDAARQNIGALRDRAPIHKKEVASNKKEFKAKVEAMKSATHLFVTNDLAQSLQAESVERFIRKHFGKDDKEDAQKDAIAKLLEDLQSRLEKHLITESESLKPLIEKYLSEYDVSPGNLKTPEFSGFEAIPFDAQGAFAGGLAAAGTLGALGLWASAMGNLGGYILVAKLASVLSVAGLGIGSGGLITFVSAIGGPITLAVGIAAVLAAGLWKYFGEAWQSRLAKKISKTLQEKGLLEKIEEKGDAFWKSTWTAFELGADAIEEKFTQYLDANERLLNDKDSRKKLEATIATLEDLRDFFGGIPWRLPV